MKNKRYYRLASIKSVFLSHEYRSSFLKNYVRDNYFTHLFCIFDFEETIVDLKHVVINENDYYRIIEPIKPYIKSYNSTGKIKPVELTDNAEYLDSPTSSYILGRFTKNFVKNDHEKGLDSIKKSAFKYKRHLRNLSNLNDKNIVISFDFEYNGSDFYHVSEVGLSVFKPQTNEIEHFYYIIEGCESTGNKKKLGLRKSFNFGVPEIKERSEVRKILMDFITKADFMIAHDINNEMQILNMKPDWDRIIDTKYCELTLNPQNKYLSLLETLRKHDVSYSHLHNAGNDAAYALLLAQTMHKKVLLNEQCPIY